MIEIEKTHRQKLTHLFEGHLGGYTANAILEGQMGKVFADSTEPSFAVLELPAFKLSLISGDSTHPTAAEYVKGLPKYAKLILSSDVFPSR